MVMVGRLCLGKGEMGTFCTFFPHFVVNVKLLKSLLKCIYKDGMDTSISRSVKYKMLGSMAKCS
jgi:hypothetical protein